MCMTYYCHFWSDLMSLSFKKVANVQLHTTVEAGISDLATSEQFNSQNKLGYDKSLKKDLC